MYRIFFLRLWEDKKNALKNKIKDQEKDEKENQQKDAAMRIINKKIGNSSQKLLCFPLD